MGLLTKKIKSENVEYIDFRNSFAIDINTPIFISKDGFSFAPNLETFKSLFSKMSKEFLQTVNIQTFKSLFNEACKFYNYPRNEAQKVLTDCIAQIESSRVAGYNA